MATGQVVATAQTILRTIQGKVVAIEGNATNIATIETDLGTVKADVSALLDRVPETPTTVDVALSWITTVFAIPAFLTAIFLMFKRK